MKTITDWIIEIYRVWDLKCNKFSPYIDIKTDSFVNELGINVNLRYGNFIWYVWCLVIIIACPHQGGVNKGVTFLGAFSQVEEKLTMA